MHHGTSILLTLTANLPSWPEYRGPTGQLD